MSTGSQNRERVIVNNGLKQTLQGQALATQEQEKPWYEETPWYSRVEPEATSPLTRVEEVAQNWVVAALDALASFVSEVKHLPEEEQIAALDRWLLVHRDVYRASTVSHRSKVEAALSGLSTQVEQQMLEKLGK